MAIRKLFSISFITKKIRRVKIKYYNFRKNHKASEQYIRLNSAQNTYDFNSDLELSENLMFQGQHDEASRLLQRLANLSSLNSENLAFKSLNTRVKHKLAENEYHRLNLDKAVEHLELPSFIPGGTAYFTNKELLARIYKYQADYQNAFDNYKSIVDMDYKEIIRVYSGYFEVARFLDADFMAEDFLKEQHGLENEHYSSLALAKYYVTQMNAEKTKIFLENLNPRGWEYYSINGEIDYFEGRYLQARKNFLKAWMKSPGELVNLGKGILSFINQNNSPLAKLLPGFLIKWSVVKRNEVVYRKLVMMSTDVTKVFESYDNTAGIKGLREGLPDKLLETVFDDRLHDCSLLVLPLWGIGDEIMIAGVYEQLFELLDSKQVKLTIGTEHRLLSLMQRSFPQIKFKAINRKHRGPHVNKLSNEEIASGEVLPNHKLYYTLDYESWKNIDDFDFVMPVPFIIKDLKKSQDDFDQFGDYLKVDPRRKNEIKTRLDAISSKPKVGISWRSGFSLHNRSIYYTSVTDWEDIFKHSDKVDFVNLQYDHCDAELEKVKAKFGVDVINLKDIDLFNDFESVCALISSLDLTIAPCTVMGDLAGALGIKTLYLINSPEGNWRFTKGQHTDIWFKAVEFVIPDNFGDTQSLLKNASVTFSKEVDALAKTR